MPTSRPSSGLQRRSTNDPRAAALTALQRVIYGQTDSQAALNEMLQASAMPPADKALCTELFYGALRHHLRLECYLRYRLPNPAKLPPEMLTLLELSCYELAYSRTPDYAAVSWAVNLVRHRFGKGLAGVANAVLRGMRRTMRQEYASAAFYARALGFDDFDATVLQQLPEVSLADETGAVAQTRSSISQSPSEHVLQALFTHPELAAALYSLPAPLLRLWLGHFPLETVYYYAAASLSAAPTCVRLNPHAPCSADTKNELLQRPGSSLLLPSAAVLEHTRGIRRMAAAGKLSIQSAAAYEALWSMQPTTWQQPVWDACAGRGGKTLALLEQGIPIALVSDPSAKRLSGFTHDVTRLYGELPPFSMPQSVTGSAQTIETPSRFGTILIDAPCSGLGTLSHRPEIAWRRTAADMDKLVETQRSLLHKAAQSTFSGGGIIYMTCTMNPVENQGQIDLFLQEHPHWHVERIWETPPTSPFREFFWAAALRTR